FFFQAEDGIRDSHVTGVQTCALPIWLALGVDGEDRRATVLVGGVDGDLAVEAARAQQRRVQDVGAVGRGDEDDAAAGVEAVHLRSEERRVGEECRASGATEASEGTLP